MCKKLHCSARFGGIKMRLLRAADCAEFAKKAEIANILFNIMSEKRAKGVINVERELHHFGRGMNNTEGMVA